MIPTKEEAEAVLKEAGERNRGPWIGHSINVGLAARYISERIPDMDSDKAYILGILHDIGRGYRYGLTTIPEHVYQGYKYAVQKNWDEVAKICMTHSYPLKEAEFYYETEDEETFIKDFITDCVYDDYDRLIQLCDSLALEEGFCLLEKRFIDVARRYGIWDTSIPRWNATFEIKEYFEKKMGCSIYEVLPKVKETTFIDIPLWKPPVETE